MAGTCYSEDLMKTAPRSQATRILWALIACGPLVTAHAQETTETDTESTDAMDEIVVVVDRDGRTVNVNLRRLEEARLRVIREFGIEQHKQEEEEWRMRLRSTMQRETSRIAWGYDAQDEAARFRYSQANYLPLDRVRPATIVSIRF